MGDYFFFSKNVQSTNVFTKSYKKYYNVKLYFATMMVDDSLSMRNDLLRRSSPAIVCMYTNIMDLVTYDSETNSKLYTEYAKKGRVSSRALGWYDKMDFLNGMYDKLEHYSHLLTALQSDQGNAAKRYTKKRFGRHEDRDRSVSFSPIIR